MRLSLLLVFVLFLSLDVQAQKNFNDGELNQISESLSSDYIIANQSHNIKGDPYLNPNWNRGFVQVSKNVKTGDLLLRYNTERNIIEFKKDNGYFGIDPSRIYGFHFYSQPHDIVFHNGFYSDKYDIERTYLLRVIYDGNIKLVAHHNTSLKENIASYGSATQKDEYVDDVNYYIIKETGEWTETKLKKKDILRDLAKPKSKQAENYAKSRDLDFEKEAEVAKLLKYYDEIDS